MPQRWAIWLSVEGDLRFCSHHDMMRALGRTALRAKLPLRYTQGFNPHPILSLALPRAVGVASRDDLWVLTLDEDCSGGVIAAALASAAMPEGLHVLGLREIPVKATPQPVIATYELTVEPEWASDLPARVSERLTQDTWPAERRKKPKGRGRQTPQFMTVDLRASVENLAVKGSTLHFAIRSAIIPSARPRELLSLLGLPDSAIANLTRTGVVYSIAPENKTDFRKETPTTESCPP